MAAIKHLPGGSTITNAMSRNRNVIIKRVYDEPSDRDGTRVLVDRLWPRGMKKEDARIDAWLRDLAPSNELRKWFHANPDRWREFQTRYLSELRGPAAAEALARLYELADPSKVSLLFASKNTDRNNATVLKDFLEGMKKPPKGTDATTGARAQARRRARR